MFDVRQNAEDILIKLGEVEVPENAFDNWTAEWDQEAFDKWIGG